MTLRVLLFLLVASLVPLAAAAQDNTPSYAGEVCYNGTTVTVTVAATPEASAILIYPTPPGGGYFMTNDGSGNYSASFSGIAPGTQFNFRLVVQVPQQYEYPPHSVSLAQGCTGFSFGSDPGNGSGGDPGNGGGGNPGGGIDPGDFGQGGLPHARAFRHDVSEDAGDWSVLIETGAPQSPLPATTNVELRYRLNDGPMQTAPMGDLGNFIWGAIVPDAATGDKVSYAFVKTVGIEPVDTAWFERTLGEAAPALPTEPIETVAGIRFRDRHENEWRFDHYPAGYEFGRTFDLKITDHGDRLYIELTTAPEVPVPAVDIKWYNQAGEVGFCDRNISAISRRMDGGSGFFTSTIDNLVHGQRVDIEFTLLASQTYYSEFIYYYVGDGRLQRESQHPLAYAAGDASIPVITVKQFAFNQHALNLPPEELRDFMVGKVIFETRWDDGLLFNPPTAFDCNGGAVGFNMGASPVFEPGLLGPLYTNNSCIECHMLDGRGKAPTAGYDSLEDFIIRLSVPGTPGGAPEPHPHYGVQLDIKATPGNTPEGSVSIEWETVVGAFDDGTPYELRRPRVEFSELLYGQIGANIPGEASANAIGKPYTGEAQVSVRVAPMLVGLGLLEAVDEAEILSWVDEHDANGDGISGRPNMVTDPDTGEPTLGRFGWKASQPDLRQQAASAFAHDMGMTSELAGDGPVEIDTAEIEAMVSYLRGLAVPPRENYEDPRAQHGKMLFEAAGCISCHRPLMRTASDAEFAPYRDQWIQPFTDLLLHDMGEDLADHRPEYGASGREWRTAPLWGVGYVGHVLGVPTDPFDPNGSPAEPNYLHDGRARSLMEAILWHGGEADAARSAVLAMDATEREALIEYVKFPFVDPVVANAAPACIADLTTSGANPGTAGFGAPDGEVTVGDLTYFVELWIDADTGVADLTTSGSNPGDPNYGSPDGDVSIADLSYFVEQWIAGCP
ncbi:MAG: di-heme oxidoredictase family protein [Planctomycetota bacterium]